MQFQARKSLTSNLVQLYVFRPQATTNHSPQIPIQRMYSDYKIVTIHRMNLAIDKLHKTQKKAKKKRNGRPSPKTRFSFGTGVFCSCLLLALLLFSFFFCPIHFQSWSRPFHNGSQLIESVSSTLGWKGYFWQRSEVIQLCSLSRVLRRPLCGIQKELPLHLKSRPTK